MNQASKTMIVETNRIREPDEAVNPQSVLIPIESDPRPQGRPGAGTEQKKQPIARSRTGATAGQSRTETPERSVRYQARHDG